MAIIKKLRWQADKVNTIAWWRTLARKTLQLFVLTVFTVTILLYGWPAVLTDHQTSKPGTVQSAPLKAAKKLFRSDEHPSFKWHIGQLSQSSSRLTPHKVYAEQPFIQTKVLYNDQPVDIPTKITQEPGNDFSIELDPTGPIKPGRYTLQTTATTPDGTTSQSSSFAWGVLAINTDKATYQPGETALIQMAALSPTGNTICDAPLTLTVTNPEGEKTNPPIAPSGVCHGDSYVTLPDYTAHYQVAGLGRYNMSLQIGNGYVLNDSFEVASSSDFVVSREGPTRIFPPAAYGMKLKFIPAQDFSGTVSESLVDGFSIVDSGGATVSDVDGKKLLSWQVDWKKGQTQELGYQFRAPPVSPAFYFVGPLKLSSNEKTVFTEARRWQIAGDASITRVKTIGTNTSSTGGTTIAATVPAAGVALGNHVIVKVGWSGATGVTLNSVTDSRSNTYQIDKQQGTGVSTGAYSGIASSKIATALVSGDTITATVSSSVTHRLIVAIEYSGLATSAWLDQTASATGTSTTPSSGSTATTTQADELVAGVVVYNSGTANTASPGTGLTEYNEINTTGKGLEDEEKIVAATGAYLADATLTGSLLWTALVATYKANVTAASCATVTTDQQMRHGNYFSGGAEQFFCWSL